MSHFELPPLVAQRLQRPEYAHEQAKEQTALGRYNEANELYQKALQDVEGRNVEYGRILLSWAASTLAESETLSSEIRSEKLQLALARAARGSVLLVTDEHRIVSAEEKDASEQYREYIRSLLHTPVSPDIAA